MGDHRASIKVEMEFHGVKDKCDMWINYFPNDYYGGMDNSVVNFFNDVYERGMKAYNKAEEKRHQEEHKKEIEANEKAELQRLKKKYEPTSNTNG